MTARTLRPVAVVLTLLLLPACVSAEKLAEAQQVAATANTALDVLQAELDGLKSDLATLDTTDPDAKATADALIELINEKSAAAEQWIDALKTANSTIQQGESKWSWLEAAVGLAAGLFPPAAIALPIVRRSRRAFEGVVASVAAGGGPKDSVRAREAMSHYPGLKARVTAQRVKIGDKVLAAVEPPAAT